MHKNNENELPEIDMDHIRRRVTEAMLYGGIALFLRVRDLVRDSRKYVLSKVYEDHPTAIELRNLNQKLNAKIDQMNDAKARELLDDLGKVITEAKEHLSNRLPIPMRQALYHVEAHVHAVAVAKRYLQFAIQRVSDDWPYADVL